MKIITPAKINLYLKIINKREDGYHNICSGVTFVDLYNELEINLSNKNSIKYLGPFAPVKGFFDNDIITKIIEYFNQQSSVNFCLDIKIKKNIPYGSGLGSSSADAAAIIRSLIDLNIIKSKINYNDISFIGADIPMCIKSRDCIINGKGEKIIFNNDFAEYYFLLVKPNFSLSTKNIYSKFVSKKNNSISNEIYNNNYKKLENDLEETAKKYYPEIKKLINYLLNLNDVLFAKMTGSGSCCYATFNNLFSAEKAMKEIRLSYPDYWSVIVKNNIKKII